MTIFKKKVYKNLFLNVFLIKYNIINNKNINFFFSLKILITDKLLQLYSIFFLWLLYRKNFDINIKKIIQKNHYFVLKVIPRDYVSFLFNYFLFFNFNSSYKYKETKKLINLSLFNTTQNLCEFFLIKSFFNLNSLKTDLFFFQNNLIFIKNCNYWKENILTFFFSFFKKV